MSGGDNRIRAWDTLCPICGCIYMLTNWMRRYAVDEAGRTRHTDTHQAKCRGWTVLSQRTDRQHPLHPEHWVWRLDDKRAEEVRTR